MHEPLRACRLQIAHKRDQEFPELLFGKRYLPERPLPPNLKPIQSLPTSDISSNVCGRPFRKIHSALRSRSEGCVLDIARSQTVDVMCRPPRIFMPLTKPRTSNRQVERP
ncbi:hypothetical protein HNY73_017275 [Argiope bruennichi]|uniref:Uncharacterized protein n=1 Tax=Argiope bruennichi TaxID=94029 RepID=A0A8T0EMC1_ARGBR|nr:hypothetical protein HNY73_017275 [Argiope bruennichi]